MHINSHICYPFTDNWNHLDHKINQNNHDYDVIMEDEIQHHENLFCSFGSHITIVIIIFGELNTH